MSEEQDHAALLAALRRIWPGFLLRRVEEAEQELGWSVQAVESLEALTDWALSIGTPLASAWVHTGAADQRARVLQVLATFWEAFTNGFPDRTATDTEVLTWLAVFAGSPTGADADALEILLLSRQTPPGDDWWALGEIGPLGYAAGLTPAETTERLIADGDQTADRLRVLAGLRGWRLPTAACAHTEVSA